VLVPNRRTRRARSYRFLPITFTSVGLMRSEAVHREAGAAVHAKPWNEPGLGKEIVSRFDISVDKHVFPRDKCPVQNENRIILVQPAGERVSKGLPTRFAANS